MMFLYRNDSMKEYQSSAGADLKYVIWRNLMAIRLLGVAMCDEYYRWRRAHNGRRGIREQSVLQPRVKDVKNVNALVIEWVAFSFVRTLGGEKRRLRHYLKRGAGDRYSEKTLAKWARPWEIENALAFEKEFAELRAIAGTLNKVGRTALAIRAREIALFGDGAGWSKVEEAILM